MKWLALVGVGVLALHGIPLFAQQIDSLEEKSQLIFRGTVLQVGATNVPELQADARMVVVRVDELLKAPASKNYIGREITVQLVDATPARRGDQFVFFTASWVYGSGLAVREVARLSDSPSVRSALSAALAQSVDRPLRRRIADAEAVISVRVLKTRPAPDKIRSGPLTEHDPDFWEADLQVLSVEKGALPNPEVTVLFANSTDIMWHRSPKFRVGQDAVVLLRKETTAGRPTFGQYIALDELDLRPTDQLAHIRKLVR